MNHYTGKRYKNFGDNLDGLIYHHLTGQELPPEKFLICGSVVKRAGGKIVWGAGYGAEGQKCLKPKKICAVRGRITMEQLVAQGYSCPETYGDPALLLPEIYKPEIIKEHYVGWIPHKSDPREGFFPSALIHPERNSVYEYLDKVLSCDLIASSSLHGLVVADAYGIPNVFIPFETEKLSREGNRYYKYRDYYSAIGEEPEPCSYNYQEVKRRARVHKKPDLKLLLNARPF